MSDQVPAGGHAAADRRVAPCACPACSSPFITTGRRADVVEPCRAPISRVQFPAYAPLADEVH